MEAEIRKLIENRIVQIKGRNVDGATADYSDDVIFYDVVGQLKFVGKDAMKTRLTEWLSSMSEIVDYEIADLKITSSSEMAYCSALNHINAKTKDGNNLDMWWRETTCYAKESGAVTITHVHSSVPFDARSGKASLGLKPDEND